VSAYRQSSFDPNAYERPGPPLKPFNWVQWSGVAVMIAGGALLLASLLGLIGWVPQWMKEFSPAPIMLMVIGMFLINSRRHPGTEIVGSEQLAQNRRVLLITVAICAAILGAALVIEFSGVI
jgi:hypothetical protein